MNQVILSGELSRDPRVVVFNSGKKKVAFTVMCKGNEPKAGVDYVLAEAWEKNAEIIGGNYTKGSQIVVVGNVRNNSWIDKKTSAKVNQTVVNVSHVLGGHNTPVNGNEVSQEVEVEEGTSF